MIQKEEKMKKTAAEHTGAMTQVPSSERVHIGFFGCRNAGKSTLVNAITGQELSVVSEVKGTTTDPVLKAMEILPLGPVVIIDTPGYDDEGDLGEKRIRKTKQILNRTDIAVLVLDDTAAGKKPDRQPEKELWMRPEEQELIRLFKERGLPCLIVCNKSGENPEAGKELPDPDPFMGIPVLRYPLIPEQKRSEAEQMFNASDPVLTAAASRIKETLAKLMPKEDPDHRVIGDLLEENDLVVLVCPIDASAPKGRLILPQQMAIRDILDAGAIALVTKETQLEQTLRSLSNPPRMVVTDSQVFKTVSQIVPEEIPLTSFSILMARYKGFLDSAVKGARAVLTLEDGDCVLMAEGCTHHRQCEDIGTVKIPNLIRKATGKNIRFDFTSGRSFPEDLSPYALVIHCGACMNTDRDVQYRMRCTLDQGIPFTNYGITIACLTGILERSLKPLQTV